MPPSETTSLPAEGKKSLPESGRPAPFSGAASAWMMLRGLKRRLEDIRRETAASRFSAVAGDSLSRQLQHLMRDLRDAVKPAGLLMPLRDFFGAAESACVEHDAFLRQGTQKAARLALVRACDALGICLDRAVDLLEEQALRNEPRRVTGTAWMGAIQSSRAES